MHSLNVIKRSNHEALLAHKGQATSERQHIEWRDVAHLPQVDCSIDRTAIETRKGD